MKKHINKIRRKMTLIISELNHTLLLAGCPEVELHLIREANGMRLRVHGAFDPAHQHSMERMADLLQPDVRNPALVESYWELAGRSQYTSDSEMALVGQMLDEAEVRLTEGMVDLDLYMAF